MNVGSKDTYQMPALGWTCFHCGETFTTVGAAADHFGETPDATPGCKIRVQLGEERGLLMALRKAEAEVARLTADLHDESSAYRNFYEAVEASIQSWKPFCGCRTLQDVFNVYDSMEGRALAAEEAAKLAVSHLDMSALKVSHCKHHERLEPWLQVGR